MSCNIQTLQKAHITQENVEDNKCWLHFVQMIKKGGIVKLKIVVVIYKKTTHASF